KIIDTFKVKLKEHNIDEEVELIATGCFGLCELGPVVIVYPEGVFYNRFTEEDVAEVVEEHLVKGRLVDRLVYHETKTGNEIKSINGIKVFEKQKRIALKNCGVINPEDIDEYIAFDGYKALEKVLTSMSSQEVLKTIEDTGLRGRGGAGFPTALKWTFAKNAQG